MNRRGFLSALFGGAAAVALAPFAKIATAVAAPALPEPRADTVGQDDMATSRYGYDHGRNPDGAAWVNYSPAYQPGTVSVQLVRDGGRCYAYENGRLVGSGGLYE